MRVVKIGAVRVAEILIDLAVEILVEAVTNLGCGFGRAREVALLDLMAELILPSAARA